MWLYVVEENLDGLDMSAVLLKKGFKIGAVR